MNSNVDVVLRNAVNRKAVPHVVGMAADADGLVYEGAAGSRVVGGDDPASADSIFRIASMTKIVCTVAALQQRDRGNLDFDSPVEAYCPDFAAIQVLAGFDDDKPTMRAPTSSATVKQLVTHTAGLSYGFWNADLARWEAATRPGRAFAAPMMADPGTKFEYGTSTDWLGRVVEAASGQSLDDYLAEHIFAPLKMNSTAFQITEEQRARCVPVHVKDERGEWVATDFDWDQSPEYWPGGHGLYSTPRDFLQFQRMLLGSGTLTGTTILDRSSVLEAFTNQIGDLWFPDEIRTADPASSCDFLAGPGTKWGWGLHLNTSAHPGARSAGSGAWAGMFNTYFWVDPAAGVTGALYSQFSPFVDPDALRTYADFERAVYASR